MKTICSCVVVAICWFGALGGVAHADAVADEIAMIHVQPTGMDRTDWKEKRRDAAKSLGDSGDKRAVPVLIELAQDETFDVIGEIAIEGLGKLGDQSAVPVLQGIVADPSRDEDQKGKAKAALKKLGASSGDTGSSTSTSTPTSNNDDLVPRGEEAAPTNGPVWDDDVLAASEQLTFGVGTANLAYNTVQKRVDFDLDGTSVYRKTMDREKTAWAYGGDAHLVAATSDPSGRAESRQLALAAEGGGEFRAYTGSGVYAIGYGQVRLEGTRLTTKDAADPGNDNNDRWLALGAQVAIGGGWGRVLDVGTRMRVARIASALEASRQLGRPIDDGVAKRLQSAWWSTRGALGSHDRLTQTVAILRDAGVLLGEPDAGTTYDLLQILDDPAFDNRASGHDVQLAFGEGYLKNWRYPSDEDAGVPEGRLEELLVRARLGRQLGATRDVGGDAFARLRLFAPMGAPAPWAIGVAAHARQWVYGDHFDARGALDATAELGVSSDDLMGATDLGMRIAGEVGWSMIMSRASTVRLAAHAELDAGELFIGARLEAAYGLLDGTFAASQP